MTTQTPRLRARQTLHFFAASQGSQAQALRGTDSLSQCPTPLVFNCGQLAML